MLCAEWCAGGDRDERAVPIANCISQFLAGFVFSGCFQARLFPLCLFPIAGFKGFPVSLSVQKPVNPDGALATSKVLALFPVSARSQMAPVEEHGGRIIPQLCTASYALFPQHSRGSEDRPDVPSRGGSQPRFSRRRAPLQTSGAQCWSSSPKALQARSHGSASGDGAGQGFPGW